MKSILKKILGKYYLLKFKIKEYGKNVYIGKGNYVLGGKNIVIGFNNKYMLDALKATDCDEVRLEFISNIRPIKITPLEGDDFLFLVLPVQIALDQPQ